MTDITDKQLHEAIGRIAATADGRLLYLYFQKVLCGTLAGDPSDCALRLHDGKRRFASELMGLMAEGIEASDGTNATGSSRAIVFARREPAAVSKFRTAREWLAAQPADATE